MKKTLFLFVALAFLLGACSKDDSPVATLRIEGVVFDNDSGEPLEEVIVELIGENSKKIYTNSEGFYSLGVHNTGSYMVKFSKENYLVVMRNIQALNYDMTIAQEQTITLPSAMYRLSGETSTVVTSRINYSALPLPLANAPYSIDFGYFNDPITGTTDENGNLSATGLPEGTGISLVFDFERDGLKYNKSYYFELPDYDLPQSIIVTPNIKEVPLLITATNLVDNLGVAVNDFDPKTNIIVEFNLPINVDAIDTYDIDISGWNTEITNMIWSNDNKKVELVVSGMEYNTNYYLQLQLISDTDFPQYLNYSINFNTKAQ